MRGVFAACFLLVACAEQHGLAIDASGSDASVADAALLDTSTCDRPTRPFDISPGSAPPPFRQLTDCDGNSYDLYGDGYCEARATVLLFEAGWCAPSRQQSAVLEETLNRPYAPRGVRIIEVLFQDPDFSAPSLDFCTEWVETFGLTNLVLIDPEGETALYFPSGVIPAAFVLDSRGIIRYRSGDVGWEEQNVEIAAALDEILAEP